MDQHTEIALLDEDPDERLSVPEARRGLVFVLHGFIIGPIMSEIKE